jgi:Putative metal-binding motif
MKSKYASLFRLLWLAVCLGIFTPALAQQSYPPSETITYQDLDGNTSTLQAFSGRYVRYALPDSWIDPSGARGLSPTELVTLIDRTDSLYGQLAELLNGEPRGDGLMTIAVVPLAGEGGVQGTALLGVKRCEIASGQLSATKAALAQGTLSETILHEVAHTFDLYRNYLSYYPDSSHSWTEFWIAYSQYLLRFGEYHSVPEIAIQEKVYSLTNGWDRRASASSWEQCVKTGAGCDGVSANRASAGLLLRYARLHGQDAVGRVFEFYKNYKATHDPNEIFDFTPEQKNDLLVEALAYGANADISNELDIWYWPLSQATRDKLRSAYPSVNPNTGDTDSDGWSPARGDLDDHDPSVYPGAVEAVDGKDNNCNGFIDEVTRTTSATTFSLPARLVGHLRSGETESYRFNASGTLLMRLRQPAGNWMGFTSIRLEGTITAPFNFGMSANEPTLRAFTLTGSGPWQLDVNSVSGEGEYEILLAYAPQEGDVLSLPLRASSSPLARTLVPNGLARATFQMPNVNAASADARPNAQGEWPKILSGFEVLVGNQPSMILAVRRSGSTYILDFVVSSQIVVTTGARAAFLVRHSPSGAQWSSSAELLEREPVIWGQTVAGQTHPAALALESPTFMAFTETRRVAVDNEMRVVLFASGLGANRSASNTRLIAQLEDGRRITLPVEYAGPTANLPGIDQIIFKTDASLSGPRILLTIEGGEESWVSLPIR